MKTLMTALAFAFVSFFTTTTLAHPGHEHPAAHLTYLNGSVHAHVFWEQGPNPAPTDSLMRIEFKNGKDHSPIEIDSRLEVALWMPSMGHGSAPTALQRVLDDRDEVLPGVYRVLNMYFTMPGDWDVQVSLTHPDGSKETRIIKVNIGGTGHPH